MRGRFCAPCGPPLARAPVYRAISRPKTRTAPRQRRRYAKAGSPTRPPCTRPSPSARRQGRGRRPAPPRRIRTPWAKGRAVYVRGGASWRAARRAIWRCRAPVPAAARGPARRAAGRWWRCGRSCLQSGCGARARAAPWRGRRRGRQPLVPAPARVRGS